MFTKDHNPSERLAADTCPRCHAVGLEEISNEAYEATPTADKYQGGGTLDPSISARCLSCGLVVDWPGCTFD